MLLLCYIYRSRHNHMNGSILRLFICFIWWGVFIGIQLYEDQIKSVEVKVKLSGKTFHVLFICFAYARSRYFMATITSVSFLAFFVWCFRKMLYLKFLHFHFLSPSLLSSSSSSLRIIFEFAKDWHLEFYPSFLSSFRIFFFFIRIDEMSFLSRKLDFKYEWGIYIHIYVL